MSLIQVENLTFAYPGSFDNVFENASFQLDTDWRLGFVGRNGRGKTTFLNLLLGKYEYRGAIRANVACTYFPYDVEAGQEDALSLMQRLCPQREEWELLREVGLLDVDFEAMYRPFSTLSHGERTKVLLAALFLGDDRFLLIDEPTNHLDSVARQAVGAYLRRKKGFLLVSHDRELLDACTDHTLAINRKTIDVRQGNFSTWWANKRLEDQFELAENEKLSRQISRLEEAARRTGNWSDRVEASKYGTYNSGLRVDRGYVGHKSAKMMRRAKSLEARRESAIQEKSRLLHNVERSESLALFPLPRSGRPMVRCKELSLYYGERRVCGGVNFEIRPGERLALTGRNGSGKSTLLRLAAGEDVRHTGSLTTAGGLVISYVPQGTDGLSGSVEAYARAADIDLWLFQAMLWKLGLEKAQFTKDLSCYSAGQKKKVLLARSLCQRAHLYIWDEPLNYIDVFSRMQLEDMILRVQPTMLFVEHDARFCKTIATGSIAL